jgi:hypothetical protein
MKESFANRSIRDTRVPVLMRIKLVAKLLNCRKL